MINICVNRSDKWNENFLENLNELDWSDVDIDVVPNLLKW
jgi:hypothetical protein